MNDNVRTSAYLFIIFSCSGFLSGCFSHPAPPTPEQQIAKIAQFTAQGGYGEKRSYPIDSLHETWRHEGQVIQITLLAPKTPGRYPLIVYLPGLGEPVQSGRLWRETWAKAGYAVFSIQPDEISDALKELEPILKKSGDGEDSEKSKEDDDKSSNDVTRGSSATVRSNELHYVGHEYFSEDSLDKRIGQVLWAYLQLEQRIKAGQSLFTQADQSKMIIAGYDLGAQTTAAIIGENFDDARPHSADFNPMAAILLSPSVDMALGNLKKRYRNIAIPFLEVTGSDDDDPYGISSPFVRTALWEYAPPGNKYLLVLKKGGHVLLSGSRWADSKKSSTSRGDGDSAEQGFDMPHFFGAPNSYRGGGGGHRGGDSWGGGQGRSGRRGKRENDWNFKQIAAVFNITTAFLDSISKSDRTAKQWLADNANHWLKRSAILKSK